MVRISGNLTSSQSSCRRLLLPSCPCRELRSGKVRGKRPSARLPSALLAGIESGKRRRSLGMPDWLPSDPWRSSPRARRSELQPEPCARGTLVCNLLQQPWGCPSTESDQRMTHHDEQMLVHFLHILQHRHGGYQQQQDLRQVDMFQNLVITDYMFVKDRLFASLNLNEKEMSLYDTVANMMERNVIHPDLVIFLQADTGTLMKNISKRGREIEKNISEDYIDALNQVYNEYFFRYQDTPLVIINTNNIDFVNNHKDLEEVINYIRQPVTGTKFFNPTTGI